MTNYVTTTNNANANTANYGSVRGMVGAGTPTLVSDGWTPNSTNFGYLNYLVTNAKGVVTATTTNSNNTNILDYGSTITFGNYSSGNPHQITLNIGTDGDNNDFSKLDTYAQDAGVAVINGSVTLNKTNALAINTGSSDTINITVTIAGQETAATPAEAVTLSTKNSSNSTLQFTNGISGAIGNYITTSNGSHSLLSNLSNAFAKDTDVTLAVTGTLTDSTDVAKVNVLLNASNHGAVSGAFSGTSTNAKNLSSTANALTLTISDAVNFADADTIRQKTTGTVTYSGEVVDSFANFFSGGNIQANSDDVVDKDGTVQYKVIVYLMVPLLLKP